MNYTPTKKEMELVLSTHDHDKAERASAIFWYAKQHPGNSKLQSIRRSLKYIPDESESCPTGLAKSGLEILKRVFG